MIGLIYVVNTLFLLLVVTFQWGKLCLWKMEQDLETWISYGTGDDIVRAKDQRKEYQSYVKKCQNDTLLALNIPVNVIKLIRADLHDKSLFKLIYVKLLWLKIRGYKI
jgi:hypothetical protein